MRKNHQNSALIAHIQVSCVFVTYFVIEYIFQIFYD